MKPLHELSISEAGRALRAGRVTAVKLTEHALERIAAIDPALRTFICLTAERALEDARRADKEIRSGRIRGPMHGIPYGLKDIYAVKGLATTCHSRLLIDNVETGDCVVQERLAAAGAVLLGKQATHEFALGGPSHDLPFPIARNPWNLERFTGGSSSGSAAAVAARLARVSFGSDTGGSIRLPSAYCSVVGVKPTTGLVSRRGVYPLSYTLDHCGPIAASVADAAFALNAIAGYDPLDPASVSLPEADFAARIGESLAGRRIAYARDVIFEIEGHSREVVDALDGAVSILRRLGATVEEVALHPFAEYAACCWVIMTSEAFAIHEETLRTRPMDYGRIFYQRVVPGAALTASDLTQALRLRRELALHLQNAILSRFDAIVTAGAVSQAPLVSAFTPDWPPSGVPVSAPTFVASATGHPALSVPMGFSAEDLPLGLQLIGRPFDEATLFSIGAAFEAAAGIGDRYPARWH